jgi:hypothetical protein
MFITQGKIVIPVVEYLCRDEYLRRQLIQEILPWWLGENSTGRRWNPYKLVKMRLNQVMAIHTKMQEDLKKKKNRPQAPKKFAPQSLFPGEKPTAPKIKRNYRA